MAKQVSALNGHYKAGEHHLESKQALELTLAEVKIHDLQQIAAFSSTLSQIATHIREQTGIQAPAPNKLAANESATILRIEPLKWLILGQSIAAPESDIGCILDLSHARTQIHISGSAARELLKRHIPLDLREHKFPIGALASSTFNELDVTIWRDEDDSYQLLFPRSFSRHCWQLLLQSAAQFNYRIAAVE